MRGILTRKAYTSQKRRIIPACAGNTLSILCALSNRSNHPRLRGEYIYLLQLSKYGVGSSPLARGIRSVCSAKRHPVGIIPACAGNTKSDKYCQNLYWDHPRLCGEYAEGMALKDCLIGSSPLVRGILLFDILRSSTLRIIPACAGNTASNTLVNSRC